VQRLRNSCATDHAAILEADNAPGMLGNLRLVGDQDHCLALPIKALKDRHNLLARACDGCVGVLITVSYLGILVDLRRDMSNVGTAFEQGIRVSEV